MYQRKDGIWAEAVSVPGEKRPKYFYGATPAAVKKKIAAWNKTSACSTTVSKALEQWVATKEKAVSYKTLEGYRAPINHINEAMGSTPVTDVTPAMVQAFVRSLADRGYKRTSVARPLNVLRMCYDYLITQPNAVVMYNPCTGVKLPSGLRQERRSLVAPADIEIIKKSGTLDFGVFALLLLYTGLRKGEALALRWEDFDFDAGVISVSKSISWQTNKPVVKEPKTAAGVRVVALLAPVVAVLPKKWSGYLFSADGGKSPLSEIQFRHRWMAYCKAAGLCDVRYETHTNTVTKHKYTRAIYTPRLVPHQLRHEYATMLLDAGVDPADAKELLGHADEATTRAVYTHIRDSRRMRTMDKLREFVENSQ